MARPEPLVINTPADLIAAIDYLIGFHPEGLVVLAIGGPHKTVVVRVDLAPDSGGDQIARLASDLTHVVTRSAFRRCYLVGYGSDELVRPSIEPAWRSLAAAGMDVKAVLRVEDGRWWSYIGPGPDDGEAYDPTVTAVAARATYEGLTTLPSRADVAAQIAPLGGAARDAMCAATAAAERWVAGLTAGAADVRQATRRLLPEGVRLIEELLDRARTGGVPASDEEIARLSVVCADLRLRDEMWVRIDQDRPGADVAFLRDVVRRVDEGYVAALACLLAFAALQGGDGALANMALDRADLAHPGYSMAALLRQMTHSGIPPHASRIALTPADLAAAWEAEDATLPDGRSDPG